MATKHCSNHRGVSPYFLKFTDTNSWTLNNLIQWAQRDNTQGEVQNTYKNSLLYIQKQCEGECFTEAQRAGAGRLLESFDSPAGRALRRNQSRSNQPKDVASGSVRNYYHQATQYGNINHGTDASVSNHYHPANVSPPSRRKSPPIASTENADERFKRRRCGDEEREHQSQQNEQEHEQNKDFTASAQHNLERIRKHFSNMTCKWKLRTGTVVEDKIMERLSSDPENIPHTLAAYFIVDPGEDGWSDWFTSDELDEISATVEPVVLRLDDLPADEKRFKGIMDALAECNDHQRLDLALLQKKYDSFKLDFKDFVHRQLLIWIDVALYTFVWLCEQPSTSRSPSESYWGHNIWGLTMDRAPIPGMIFNRGETNCEADRRVKNSARTRDTKSNRRVGNKVDGIWFDNATGDEYLAVLSAKHFNGAQDDDKSESDYLVLAKTLSRMLLHLHTRVNNRPEETRKMRVTGICEHAYRSRILTVQMTGHVTVLHTNDTVEYPNHPESLRQWTQIMETMMAVRQEIQTARALIKGSRS